MALGTGNVCQQLCLIIDQPNICRVEILRLRAHLLAPAPEVRQIVRAKMGKCRDPFGGRIRIEHDLDQPEKAIVFDDEF